MAVVVRAKPEDVVAGVARVDGVSCVDVVARADATGHVGVLPVREGEDPWTEDEAAQVRSELESDVARLRAELAASEEFAIPEGVG